MSQTRRCAVLNGSKAKPLFDVREMWPALRRLFGEEFQGAVKGGVWAVSGCRPAAMVKTRRHARGPSTNNPGHQSSAVGWLPPTAPFTGAGKSPPIPPVQPTSPGLQHLQTRQAPANGEACCRGFSLINCCGGGSVSIECCWLGCAMGRLKNPPPLTEGTAAP